VVGKINKRLKLMRDSIYLILICLISGFLGMVFANYVVYPVIFLKNEESHKILDYDPCLTKCLNQLLNDNSFKEKVMEEFNLCHKVCGGNIE
jgi:hypothetical protein